MKTMNIKKLICAITLVLQSFSSAQGCPCYLCGAEHVFSLGDDIELDEIVGEHLQNWYHISSPTRLRAYAEDWDWVDCCEESWNHTGWIEDSIMYTWSGPGLFGATSGAIAIWWPDSYTPVLVTIKVRANDVAYMLPCGCDMGWRDDRYREKTIERGAWQAAASMVVFGTNKPTPETATAYEEEYFDYHLNPPFVDTPAKDIPVSLNSSHISIGNYSDETVISPNPQEVALSPIVTSQADWNMFCVPEDAWAADMSGFVGCTVDKEITGHLWSKVWDDGPGVGSGDVTVSVDLGIPPISIGISRTFDLSNAMARSQVAMGLGYQSDLPFEYTPYGGEFEHRDDSNFYSYTGTTPHIGSTSISTPWSNFNWCVSKASGTDKTASMETKTEGWVKAKETWTHDQAGSYYYDAYGEVWQAGTITYRIWAPHYYGERHLNPGW